MPDEQPKKITLEEYKKEFGLEETDKEGKSKKNEVLKYALDIRKFEIDLYWKRATYFWTFIGATMAGYFLIQASRSSEKEFLSVIAACLGFLFSFAWFYVNKGSKYWQENWENHVDMIENFVVGPLYKTVLDRPEGKEGFRSFVTGPAAYSVSKINQIVSLFVMLLWVVIIFQTLLSLGHCALKEWRYLTLIVLTILACLGICRWGKTDEIKGKNVDATLRETTIKKDD